MSVTSLPCSHGLPSPPPSLICSIFSSVQVHGSRFEFSNHCLLVGWLHGSLIVLHANYNTVGSAYSIIPPYTVHAVIFSPLVINRFRNSFSKSIIVYVFVADLCS